MFYPSSTRQSRRSRNFAFILFFIVIIWALDTTVYLIWTLTYDTFSVTSHKQDIEYFNYSQPFQPVVHQQLGSVIIGDDMDIRFCLIIHNTKQYWSHILQIGDDKFERKPLIALHKRLHPNSTTAFLHTRFSTHKHWNDGYDFVEPLMLNVEYNIHLLVTQNKFLLDINNKTVIEQLYRKHDSSLSRHVGIHSNDPWWFKDSHTVSANVTISKLYIESIIYTDDVEYPYGKYKNLVLISIIGFNSLLTLSLWFYCKLCAHNAINDNTPEYSCTEPTIVNQDPEDSITPTPFSFSPVSSTKHETRVI